jgi:hypothetical protein
LITEELAARQNAALLDAPVLDQPTYAPATLTVIDPADYQRSLVENDHDPFARQVMSRDIEDAARHVQSIVSFVFRQSSCSFPYHVPPVLTTVVLCRVLTNMNKEEGAYDIGSQIFNDMLDEWNPPRAAKRLDGVTKPVE